MKIYLLTFLITISTFVNAQVINGKIEFDDDYFNSDYLENIQILNKKTNQTTVTDNKGFFKINATIGDDLVISSPFMIQRNVKVRNRAFEDNFIIYVEPNLIELKEVRVSNLNRYLNQNIFDEKDNLNTIYKKLGLNPNIKYLEPQKDVSKFKATDLLNVGRWADHISGRNKKEREIRSIENQIKYYNKVEELFDKQFYTNELGLKEHQIKEFIRWVNSQEKLEKMVENYPREMIREKLYKYAPLYKEIINKNNS